MIDYNRCIVQANRLQSLANEYQNMYNYVNNLANNSVSYWQGQSNTAFRQRIEQWKREALAIKTEMESLSLAIKQVARQIEIEEMSE